MSRSNGLSTGMIEGLFEGFENHEIDELYIERRRY